MRLNYYPPLGKADDESGAGRLLGHEDVDLFTILPAAKVSGLQVWNHMSQKWVRLDAPEGSLIINTGDYMQRITNDRLPSTSHRVGKPADGSHMNTARISFPMAVYVWENEILEVLPGLGKPKYDPIKAITFHTRSTSKFYGDAYAVESPVNNK
jgi:isopenicillin N synthase-like dioxygenase